MMARALVVHEHGPTSNVVIDEIEIGEPAAGEVRIEVAAAGINFPDILVIGGTYQRRLEPPFVPGSECAGTIAAVGPGVEGFAVGDRVLAIPLRDAFAEQIIVSADVVFRIPHGMGFVEAAAFPIVYGTSAHALQDRGRLVAGETVLINGAGGGIGLSSVELATMAGAARVIASVGSAAKADAARAAGASDIIDYRTEDVRERVLEITEGRGVDVVVDPVGGAAFDAAMRCIAWRGRALVVGFASGTIPTLAVNRTLLKGCEVVGVLWGESIAREPERFRALMNGLLADVAEGRLHGLPVTTVSMEDVSVAFDALARRSAVGKFVLDLTRRRLDDESGHL